MRFIVLLLLAAAGAGHATPADTLESLLENESQDLAEWQALAAAATEAGAVDIANQAAERILAIETQRFPCLHNERFKEFDFWLGEWDVHIANGTFAGSNSIKRAEQGCVLTEQWTSATGGSGQSINYFDADSGEWVQIWNDSSGSQINIRGNRGPEGMLLEGQIHYVGNGTTAPFRGLWTPLPDGRVRQFFEQSNDDGKSWTAWFEGFYSRRSSDKGQPDE